MNDEADIRFVDAHSKSDGSTNHVDLLHEKLVLIGRAGSRIHAGMVGQGLDAINFQCFSQLFHLFPGKAVDDAGFSGIGQDELNDFLGGMYLGPDLVVEVVPAEGRLEYIGTKHVQVLLYIVLDLRGGGGG